MMHISEIPGDRDEGSQSYRPVNSRGVINLDTNPVDDVSLEPNIVSKKARVNSELRESKALGDGRAASQSPSVGGKGGIAFYGRNERNASNLDSAKVESMNDTF